MREILFRGKRKDNGEWVEGSLILTTSAKEKTYIVDSCYCYDGCIDEDGYADFDRLNAFEVIPETAGQYTGLTDKNGKKIFEGDIVHAVYSNGYIGVPDTDYGNLIVGFDDTYYGGACYSMKIVGDTGYRIFSAGLINGVTVIGNTHDNPELLKEGDGE